MSAPATTALPEALSENQKSALINLLADEDGAVYRTVREKILSYGSDVIGWLQPHTLSDDPALRRRAQDIISHFGRQAADTRFLGFCLKHGEEFDLEEAAGLLSLTQYPSTNLEGYRALFDSWASELRTRIDRGTDAETVLGVVNQYLFEELGFSGDEHHTQNPECCYLTRVVDRRSGNPITLSAIFLFVARRLRLPVVGIGLPGHFICRYQSSVKEIYIDAFNGGKFWTKADCIKHLLNSSHGLQDGYLAPVSSRRILLRMCANLHQSYATLEMAEEASRMQRYLVALAK